MLTLKKTFKLCLFLLIAICTTSCIETLPTKLTKTTETNAEQINGPDSKAIQVSALGSTSVDKECKTLVINTTTEENLVGMATFAAQIGASLLANNLTNGLSGSVSGSYASENDQYKKLLWYYSKNYVWLPMSVEKAYGDKIYDSFASKIKPRDERNAKQYAYADSLLKNILDGIDEKHNYQFELYILKEPGENAVAGPGGKIYLNEKLARDPKLKDRALFVLAHEISHVLQRHETKSIQTRVMDSIDIKNMVSSIKDVQSGNNVSAIIQGLVAGKQLFTKNNIDQEMQADSCGVKLLFKVMNGDKQRVGKTLNAFISKLTVDSSKENTKTNNSSQSTIKGFNQLLETVTSPIDQHPNAKERTENLRAIFERI